MKENKNMRKDIKAIERDIKRSTENVKQCLKDINYKVNDSTGTAQGLVFWAQALEDYRQERKALLDEHFGVGNY